MPPIHYTEQHVRSTVDALERELRNHTAPDYAYRGYLRSELRKMLASWPGVAPKELMLRVKALAA